MTTFIVLTVLIVLMTVENYCACRDEHPVKIRVNSYLTNIGLLVWGDTIMSLLSVGSLMTVAAEYSGFGILGGKSDVFRFVLAFVSFDLMLYFWHRTRHRSRFLWKMHKTHHSDKIMNATTAFRLHFFEIFLTTVVKSLFIVVVGISADFVLVNEMIVVLCAMFHHTNIAFRGERWASFFIVVPYIHRVHHSVNLHYSNFGAVFSFWDRWFGTLKQVEPEEIGLKTFHRNFFDVLFLREKPR